LETEVLKFNFLNFHIWEIGLYNFLETCVNVKKVVINVVEILYVAVELCCF